MGKRKNPASKRGRKPKLDPVAVAAALVELMGNVAAVGKKFGVDRTSVRDLIDKRADLKRICIEAREGMKDHAESSLYHQVLKGEAWAVCFFLKTQAKDRGYIEKQEIEQTGSVRMQIVEELTDAPHHEDPHRNGTPPLKAARFS